MTISGLTSTSLFTPPPQATNPQSKIRQQIAALFQDIKAGNLSAAQSDLGTVNQLLGGTTSTSNSTDTVSATGASTSTSGQTNPLSQLLSQIGSSLQSGDITGAQSALSTFETQAQQTQGDGGSTPHHHHHHGGGGGGSGSGVNDALAQLIQSVQSGDLTGAQNSYAALFGDSSDSSDSSDDGLSALGSIGATTGTGSASSTTTVSNSTDSVTGTGTNPATGSNSLFAQLLAGLGSALQNNDIVTAQQDLTTFAQSWKTGSAVNVTA